MNEVASAKRFLFASDFDQTLSFNDSGLVLSELIGAHHFEEKVAGLARSNLVHQAASLPTSSDMTPTFGASVANIWWRRGDACACATTYRR